MGLNSDDTIKNIMEKYEAETLIEESLEESKVSLVTKPTFKADGGVSLTEEGEPVVPEDATTLSHLDLGKLYSMCNAYLVYVESSLALIDTMLKILKDQRTAISIKIEDDLGEDKKAKELTKLDSRYIAINSKCLAKEGTKTILDSKAKQFKSYVKTLSREMSRRQLELDSINRETNAGNNFNRKLSKDMEKRREK